MNPAAALLPGALAGVGFALVCRGWRPRAPRLDDALALFTGAEKPEGTEEYGSAKGERLGSAWLRRHATTLPPHTLRALKLLGRTPARHYSIKVTGLLVGLALPSVLGALSLPFGGDIALPMALGLILGALGFVVPDLRLRLQVRSIAEDATEALLTYFDLVTLERLANQSATQSLHAAASLSDNAVFAQIRGALDRARLEQRMPFAELRRVGHQLELPALVDLADVLRLEETGAPLSLALRARVRELRDAHLTALKVAAAQVSERMTLFMVVPSLLFGLILLIPPLLRLAST